MKKTAIAIFALLGITLICSEGDTLAWRIIATSSGAALLWLSSKTYERFFSDKKEGI